MKRKASAWMAMLVWTVMSCNSNSDKGQPMLAREANPADMKTEEMADERFPADTIGGAAAPPEQEPTSNEKRTPASATQTQPTAIEWDKKIVKTARLQAEVKDYNNFGQQVAAHVTRFGGYISAEQQQQTDNRWERTMTIRVPVDRFDGAIAALLSNTESVTERSITADDVTSQIIDGRSRLEAKRQVRLRYLELLKAAKNMEDILTVQKEINAIQEEIERVNGQLNFLQHTSAMSTIHFTFFQVLKPSEKPADEPGFITKVGQAFRTGWLWIGEIVLALVYLWPLLAGATVAIALYRRRRQGMKPQRMAEPTLTMTTKNQ